MAADAPSRHLPLHFAQAAGLISHLLSFIVVTSSKTLLAPKATRLLLPGARYIEHHPAAA